jgi:hypothetical protein
MHEYPLCITLSSFLCIHPDKHTVPKTFKNYDKHTISKTFKNKTHAVWERKKWNEDSSPSHTLP